MLEYFTYKKFKKNKEAKQAREEEAAKQVAAAQDHDATSSTTPDRQHTDLAVAEASASSHSAPVAGRPVLDRSDESFLQNLLAEDGPAPPLPPRVNVPELDWPSDDASSFQHSRSAEGAPAASTESQEESKEAAKKSNRFSQVFSRVGKKKPKHGDTLSPDDAKPADSEEEREKKDLSRVLDRLNLSATGNNNKVTALTDDSAEVLRKFTQIFKDLANGVPTAYDDLVNLIKDRDGAITKGFEKLPSGLQKLVTQLPDKITASIAPEVLAAAAKSQGMEAAAAQNLLSPSNLFKLITEPGALVAMLRAIVTTLQQRWPAFIGVNVLWSVALCCKFSVCSLFGLYTDDACSAHVRTLVLLQAWTRGASGEGEVCRRSLRRRS
jgi:hypothetical protein